MKFTRFRRRNHPQEKLYLTISEQNLKKTIILYEEKKAAAQTQIHEKVFSGTLISLCLLRVNHFMNT